MFCQKCGNPMRDDELFCPKCGEKAVPNEPFQEPAAAAPAYPVQQPAAAPVAPPQTAAVAAAEKKKSKLPLVLGILGGVILVVAAIAAFVLLNRGDEDVYDYVATVRGYTPFANSQNIPYSCGEVFDKYLPDAEWTVSESGDIAYVDISGTAKGTDKDVVITIQVEAEGDQAKFDLYRITEDGSRASEEEADIIFLTFFTAYDENIKDLSDFVDLMSEVRAALQGDDQLTETYRNKEEGFSFRYPADWTVEDLDEMDPDTLVSVASVGGLGVYARIGVIKGEYDESYFSATKLDIELEYSTADDFSDVKVSDVSDISLDGRPAKKISLTAVNDVGTSCIFTQYFYLGGSNSYVVTCVSIEDYYDTYAPILAAIMDTYTITAADTPGELPAGSDVKAVSSSAEAERMIEHWMVDNPLGDMAGVLEAGEGTDRDGNEVYTFELWIEPRYYAGMIDVRKSDGYMTFREFDFDDGMDLDAWYAGWSSSGSAGGADLDLYFNGISLTDWVDSPPDILYDMLGWPDYGTPVDGDLYLGGEYFGYDEGVLFIINDLDGTIGWIVGAADVVDINGLTLDITRMELIDILGMPVYEDFISDEMDGDYYLMRYELNGVTVDIEMDDAASIADTVTLY